MLACITGPPVSRQVIWGKTCHLSEALFPHLKNEGPASSLWGAPVGKIKPDNEREPLPAPTRGMQQTGLPSLGAGAKGAGREVEEGKRGLKA